MTWCKRVETRSTGMHDVRDIRRLLFILKLDQEAAWVIFHALYVEGNSVEALEQFLAYMVNTDLKHLLLIKKLSRSANFQNSSLIDNSYPITNSFYIGQQV